MGVEKIKIEKRQRGYYVVYNEFLRFSIERLSDSKFLLDLNWGLTLSFRFVDVISKKHLRSFLDNLQIQLDI
ncbi:MAG: hypothetical protein QXX12_06665 [Nanopusillaceae archaeon]